VGIRDLVDEAKKRIVLLVVCVVGLSYLMSLTSASVVVNLPAALFLILLLRYMSLDFEARKKAATYKGKQNSVNGFSETATTAFQDLKPLKKPDWKHKVNSPVVADAIEQFTRHIVSEWVTNLWYSRITSDVQGPEQLAFVMNSVIGEISSRMRNVNLIDLLTRDIIDVLCNHLELFRTCKKKLVSNPTKSITLEQQDIKLKSILAAEKKLHPVLFSAEAEHKVLQQVTEGLALLTFQPEDLQCSTFRYISRELICCAVIRPVLNLANPRFVNERIESAVMLAGKANKANAIEKVSSPSKINESPVISSDPSSPFLDPSFKGVELVQLNKEQDKTTSKVLSLDDLSLSKDPLLSMDTRSTRSWSSLPDGCDDDVKGAQQHPSGGEWGDVLDVFSRRKTEALAPEHFDNMWTKGRNYKSKEDGNQSSKPSLKSSSAKVSNHQPKVNFQQNKEHLGALASVSEEGFVSHLNDGTESESSVEADSWSSGHTEDDETSNVMRFDSPGVKVWDSKNKRNSSRIHHPLENFERNRSRRKDQPHSKRLHRTKSAKKRSRPSIQNGHTWQEVESNSFLLGDGHGTSKHSKENVVAEYLSEDSEPGLVNRSQRGASTSSSTSLTFPPEIYPPAVHSANNSISHPESFFRLRCEVLGANIVKCGAKTFAVYSISVTDVNGHTWSIKRRYQHFEELHRRLKEFPEYVLHLPPKHFLSTGLDVFVIQERCRLLDRYLKNLFQLPTVSGSIEVWDFLSVDSQMYIFSDSLYIIDTLSGECQNVHCYDDFDLFFLSADNEEVVVSHKFREYQDGTAKTDPHSSNKNGLNGEKQGGGSSAAAVTGSKEGKGEVVSFPKNPLGKASPNSNDSPSAKTHRKGVTSSSSEKEAHSDAMNNLSDPTIPSEWVPPNLSVPILDLVDVILQLKDGGWIRRKAFWAAKQVLQLGMGDAFDDWLIEKIQLLRTGSVVASGIRRLETILWPDGIFITKHSSRQRSQESVRGEAERRAKFVYELMIDKAPAGIVGLVGRKEYEKCAEDVYCFIQSSVFMKQLGFRVLEVVLLSAFPELDGVFKQFDAEKEKYG
ncbi:hypothetical protein M569_07921, partial [Genlisea aurea]